MTGVVVRLKCADSAREATDPIASGRAREAEKATSSPYRRGSKGHAALFTNPDQSIESRIVLQYNAPLAAMTSSELSLSEQLSLLSLLDRKSVV